VKLRAQRAPVSMLEGSIWKGMVYFAIPIFFGNLFQQLYNTADTFIVGNFIGKEALAAVSSSGHLIFMLTGFLNGVAMGGSILVAKYFGARDYKSMRTAIETSLAFAFVGGLVMSALGVILSPALLRLMNTPADVMPNSVAYFRTYFLGAVATFVYNICMGILQAVGDSKHPLYYLVFSSVLNVCLDLLFVGVFRWGVASAALATVISQAVSAILCLLQLSRTREVYRVDLRKLRIHGSTLRQIVRLGLPSGLQNCAISIGNVVVQSNINIFGANAIAGCGSYSKIEGFVLMPMMCFSMALSTFVGQNLGARQYDRVRKGAKFGLICAVIIAELTGILIFFFAPSLLRLFNDDPAVIAYGTSQARIESLLYFLVSYSNCAAGVLRGAGKTNVPMMTMFGCWCLVRVTVVSALVHVFQTITVIFIMYPVTWLLSSTVFMIYYNKADWIHHFERLEEEERRRRQREQNA